MMFSPKRSSVLQLKYTEPLALDYWNRYEEALCIEFELRGIGFRRQVEIDVLYKGQVIKGQRIDILVEKEVIVEIKSLSKLPEVSTAQILSYLKATGLRRGLLINFGAKLLREGIKRVSL